MPPESMVHALEKTVSLLTPNGQLIDIHPHPDEPELLVRLGDTEHRAGWLDETDDRVEYEQADAALETAVSKGLFRLLQRETFTFNIFADSLADLQAYLAETWSDARIDDQVAMQIEALLSAPRPGEIVLRERVRLARLEPARRSAYG